MEYLPLLAASRYAVNNTQGHLLILVDYTYIGKYPLLAPRQTAQKGKGMNPGIPNDRKTLTAPITSWSFGVPT